MKISLADHSHYFKGLLLLIRKDRHIHDQEKQFMMRIGKILGFEKEFCENAIKEILGNEYILDESPRFSDPEIAKCFIKDGIRLALIDKHLDDKELEWLLTTAKNHGLNKAWLDDELSKAERTLNISELSLQAHQFQLQ